MDKLLAIWMFVLAVGVAFVAFPTGPAAVLFASLLAVVAIILINRNKGFSESEKVFLRQVFLVGLTLRVVLAVITYIFQLQDFFGGDSITYDEGGFALYNYWFGNVVENSDFVDFATKAVGSGYGMHYIVAGIYTILGRNPLAIQLLNAVLGAGTACLIYVCAKKIFSNSRVAKFAAIFVAVFPSLIVWSSQGLKDGIICFLLALAISSLLSLQEKFSYINIALLLISLGGIFTLRFYIFFAFAIAIFGAFVIGAQKTVGSIAKQVAVLIVITIGLTYLGVIRNAQTNLEKYGNLETLQNSRIDQARSAESGFGADIDVSTPEGALQVLPLGLTYLLLAPFPWQVTNFRQLITLPEVFLWWACVPFMIGGIIYTVKNKLRKSISVVLLTLLLTISYAIFQGNVGTAYRMRAQMQIFYFIFVAVGFVLWQEKRENQILIRNRKRQIRQNKIL
jgi:Dolichyl-phosphate-mannose-protein mannosyltransferase